MKADFIFIASLFLSVFIGGCSRSIPLPEGKPEAGEPRVLLVTVNGAIKVFSLLDKLKESMDADRNLEEILLRFGGQSVRMKVFFDLGMLGIFVREKGEFRDISPVRAFFVAVVGSEYKYDTYIDSCGVALKNAIDGTRPTSPGELLDLIDAAVLERGENGKLVQICVYRDIQLEDLWPFLYEVSRLTPYLRLGMDNIVSPSRILRAYHELNVGMSMKEVESIAGKPLFRLGENPDGSEEVWYIDESETKGLPATGAPWGPGGIVITYKDGNLVKKRYNHQMVHPSYIGEYEKD